ncbi:MAG TPA: class I SAM-dependent methyltransferase [Verrucomicrobiae bacterium]|nr:class I SAM-dependent methyltransferase [Verrucomicrobiae bacterium]
MNAAPKLSTPARPRLKLTITAAAETAVRGGHPWVYADSIRAQNRAGQTGELAVIYDRKDKFLAVGLFDSGSPLRVRVLHVGRPLTLDAAWWQQHLQAALARRVGLADAQTNGLRLINGESDGWPGLVLDRYDTTLVMKLYTAAWLPRLAEVQAWLLASLSPVRLVLRLSRNIQMTAAQQGAHDGQVLHGPPVAGAVIFQESGLRFEADVVRGQKTGFFLDQRENRRRVETFAAGADVLNAFSFSGGFSLYAARGGATSVTDLDISPHALAAAARNFQLNQGDPRVARCRHTAVQADAFQWVEQAPPARFDVVILDPPSLAKREAERAGAIQAYGKLAANGIRLLRPRGVLVAASCSAHVSAGEFFGAVRAAARLAGWRFEELATTGHAPDHAATFAEAQYLKCIYLRFA